MWYFLLKRFSWSLVLLAESRDEGDAPPPSGVASVYFSKLLGPRAVKKNFKKKNPAGVAVWTCGVAGVDLPLR